MVKHVDTAMIMAAGKGTRMMPLTADRPKPLIEVGGVALLDHVLGHLRDAGIGKIDGFATRTYVAIERSQASRSAYLNTAAGLRKPGPYRAGMGCANAAHAFAAMPARR